ncbi:MAG: hypothetical protein HQ539_00250 [Parcubacteria group bacterium]|nr:hypothetical protein [Parcubacteria group bacterium]
MSNLNFEKSNDKALFAYYILRRLGTGRVDLFKDRLRSQKVQYLAQLFEVSPHYPYNLYIYGPYSPVLANDLFQIQREGSKVKLDKLIPLELEYRFNKLKKFIEGKTNKQLEIIATVHWLLSVVNFSKDEARKRVIEWKGATSDEVNDAFIELKNL